MSGADGESRERWQRTQKLQSFQTDEVIAMARILADVRALPGPSTEPLPAEASTAHDPLDD